MKKESQPKKVTKKVSKPNKVTSKLNIPLDEFRISMNELGWTRVSGWLMNTEEMRELIGRQGEFNYRIKDITVNLELED